MDALEVNIVLEVLNDDVDSVELSIHVFEDGGLDVMQRFYFLVRGQLLSITIDDDHGTTFSR